jgi:hypothetical protein
VSLDVVLGYDPGPTGYQDFLSLPTGSYVIVGFTDESIIDGPGNDISITEIGGAGELAQVYVSSDNINFILLGFAADDTTTAFDLALISYSDPVTAVKVIGLDNFGDSPGFDVVNVAIMENSIGPPVPIPSAVWLLGSGLIGLVSLRRRFRY